MGVLQNINLKWRERGLNWFLFYGPGNWFLADLSFYGFIIQVPAFFVLIVLPFSHMLYIVIQWVQDVKRSSNCNFHSARNKMQSQRNREVHIRNANTIIVQVNTRNGLEMDLYRLENFLFNIFAVCRPVNIHHNSVRSCCHYFDSMGNLQRNTKWVSKLFVELDHRAILIEFAFQLRLLSQSVFRMFDTRQFNCNRVSQSNLSKISFLFRSYSFCTKTN